MKTSRSVNLFSEWGRVQESFGSYQSHNVETPTADQSNIAVDMTMMVVWKLVLQEAIDLEKKANPEFQNQACRYFRVAAAEHSVRMRP
jgi:hypothetical protein